MALTTSIVSAVVGVAGVQQSAEQQSSAKKRDKKNRERATQQSSLAKQREAYAGSTMAGSGGSTLSKTLG